MCNKPIFSVIIPTYNREKILKRAIDSILRQTCKDFELIIVDDGSADHTKELVKSYDDVRIRYIYKENGGQNSALNKGIKSARGQYIGFCDSDDSWFPQKLERHLEKYASDLEIKAVYDLTGILRDGTVVLGRNDTCEGWCYKEVLEQGYLTSPTFLTCRTECFDKIGMLPEDLVYGQDDDLCFKLCKNYKVGLVREILGILYDDADNRVTSAKKKCAEDYFRLWKSYRTEVIENCGVDVLKRKYFKALHHFCFMDETEKAQEVLTQIQDISDENVIRAIHSTITQLLGDSKKVILYGTGENASQLFKLLHFYQFDFVYIVAVTRLCEENNTFFGIQVKELQDLRERQYKDLPVIVASNKYCDEMIFNAEKMGFHKIISFKKLSNIMF